MSGTTELLMEQIVIRRPIREDGGEVIRFETSDATGEPLGINDALNLLEYSKLELTIELIHQRIFEDIGIADDEDDE